MSDDTRRPYRPIPLSEQDTRVCLINEPLPPDNVAHLIQPKPRPIHAVLCEALASTQALLRRLDAGLSVSTRGREPIRELYVQARRQRDALAACLELDGLE